MILGWSSFKIIQMVPVHCISGSQKLKIDFLTKNLKNFLIRNHWTEFNIILQKCSFGDPLPRLFKPFGFVKKHGRQGAGLIFPIYIYIENFKNLLARNHWTDFNIILQKCSFGDLLPRLFKPFGFFKKHGHQGAGLITLYIYIENFKNLLVRSHWTDFYIILQKCTFGDPLPRLFKPFGFVKKHGRQGGGTYFLYMSI